MANTYPRSLISFFDSKIRKDLNCYVDDLNSYLTSIGPITNGVFEMQYIKHALNLKVNFNLAEEKQVDFICNYASITNFKNSEEPEKTIYYFVDSWKPVAQNTIEVNFILDTVNSFGQGSLEEANPANFLDTTKVEREHRDRFAKPADYSNTNTTHTFYRFIDRTDEGLTPPLVKFWDQKLQDELLQDYATVDNKITNPEMCWYLVYMRKKGTETGGEEPQILGNDFECKICADSSIPIAFNTYSGSCVYQGHTYTNPTVALSLATIKDLDLTNETITKVIKLPYRPYNMTRAANTHAEDGSYLAPSKFGPYAYQLLYYSYWLQTWTVMQTPMLWDDLIYEVTNLVEDPNNANILKGRCFLHFSSTDIKNLPDFYAPQITSILCAPKTYIHVGQFSAQEAKSREPESKLFNSNFFTDKIAYDSFSNQIAYENYSTWTTGSGSDRINIDFKPTNTINSKFAFKINKSSLGNYEQDSDFDEYLLTTRNNEMTLLNDNYLNYIKNGYNYDKKAAALQVEAANRNATTTAITAGVSTAAGIVSTVAGALLTATGAGAGVGVPLLLGGIGLASTGVAKGVQTWNAFEDAANATEAAKNTLANKLNQLATQAIGTTGTDDIDLLTYYSDNKLHWISYRPKIKLLESYHRLFDINGYATNTIKKPVVNTRYWYNYLKCTPAIKANKINKTFLDDITQRYSQGVMILHHHKIDNVDTWNWELEWENWESWILGE